MGGDLWRLEQEGEFLDVHHRCHGAQALGGAGLQEGRVLGAGRQGLLNAKALDSPDRITVASSLNCTVFTFC